MNSSRLRTVAAAAILFASSAAVVAWQNARLTVLWDVSYILENAWRIACGDVPYRDFPFPYAPLTFLVQAGIMRLFGRHYFLHITYATVVGGAASATTYAIAQRVTGSRIISFLLCAPLAVLGIYSILPNPFYDPDCCFVILIALALFAAASSREWPAALTFFAGFALGVPLFVKQNIGLATLAGTLGAAIVIARERRRAAALFAAGCATSVAAGIAVIAATAGLANYVQWTIRFAAQRRLPPASQIVEVFTTPSLFVSLPLFAAGAALIAMSRKRSTAFAVAGAVAIAVPFLNAVVAIVTSDEPQIALLNLWPAVIIAGAIDLVARVKSRETLHAAVLLIALSATGGAFLSQALWGSTYGIWPLFVVVAASSLARIAAARPRAALVASALICGSLLVAGSRYIRDNDRLQYAKLDENIGPLHHSSLPPLRGLAMRGDWLPDFEELVAWSDAHIPRRDAIVMLPGEDLFYFTTGRRPRFPVLLFDRTVNPYDAETIARLVDERRVDWVIVKRDLQIEGTPMPFLPRVVTLLQPRFELEEELNNYDIWRRAPPDEEP